MAKQLRSRKQRVELAAALRERELRAERARQSAPGGLIHFIRYFWHILEPGRPFLEGWALWAICRHLEAVSDGRLRRLLINCPPGSAKSLLCNVFWPAWDWSANKRPDRRWLSFSYASHLTQRDNDKMLLLLQSSEFIELWGDKWELREKGKKKISNSRLGFKFASSVGGTVTGERGDIIVLDDPHSVTDGESEAVRESTTLWFQEAMANRLNDMDKSAVVIICQRVHEADVSGVVLAKGLPYEHLCIPMEYEPGNACSTSLGWSDPRTVEGECFFPERFTPDAVAEAKLMGEHVWAGQYQQRPEVRGGGMLKRAWWQTYTPPEGKWPLFDHVIASLDPAFTKDTLNDPSGFTIWGAFRQDNGDAGIMLLYAFRKHLELHGGRAEKWKGETDDDFRDRCKDTWGLVEHVHDACKRFHVDHLIIEAKGSGHSVAQEMRRLHGRAAYSIELVDPKGLDKIARVIRIQPMFTEGQIFAPYNPATGVFRNWAQMVIDECAIFPRGKHDDLVDSTTQALYWLRSYGFAVRHSEMFEAKADAERYTRPIEPLYPT